MRFSDQPLNWFFQFSIGDMVLTTVPPQYVISFTHVRTMLDSANQFTLQVIYEGMADLEDMIVSTGFQGNCYFRYGIVGGSSTGVYKASIIGYDIEFFGGATQLNIQGITQAVAQNQKAYSKAYKGNTIDNYVTQIAKDNGYNVGLIEPCAPLRTSIDDITGKLTHKTFHQLNTKPLIFIQEELVPYAVSAQTGLSGYNVYFTDKNSSRPTLNFCTPQFHRPSVANYSYYAGPNSNIINWTPQIYDAYNVAQGGGQVGSLSVDSLSNELRAYYHTNITDSSMPTLGGKNYTNKDIGLTFMNNSSMMQNEMEAKAKALWTKNANLSYQSDMTIPLDAEIEPNTTVDVLIMTPSGQPHYSTGTYLVMQIEDQLNAGGAQSTCTLIKNAVSKGSSDAGGKQVQKPRPTVTNNKNPRSAQQGDPSPNVHAQNPPKTITYSGGGKPPTLSQN